MTQPPKQPTTESGGLPSVLRLIAGITIVLVAVVAILVVTNLIPREQLGELAGKIVVIGAILALAATAVALLVKWGRKA
jgi:hypothetical protein